MERLLYSFFPKEVTDSLRLTARALFYLHFNSYFTNIEHDYIFFTKLVAKWQWIVCFELLYLIAALAQVA